MDEQQLIETAAKLLEKAETLEDIRDALKLLPEHLKATLGP